MSGADQQISAEGDPFAHIDLVSNHSVFKERSYYWALLKGEELPVHTFSSFIHEATHHWCFLSPVGVALMLLYLSAARRALRSFYTGDESERTTAMNDLFTYELVVSWLRPLTEGLAQFAEYDVLIPESKTSLISPPLRSALIHLFEAPKRIAAAPEGDPRDAYYDIDDAITRWRLSRQTIERKSELLLQPVAIEESNYLLGYLTVKQLWKSASRFYEQLEDADVFMMFLRKFVFGDHALAAKILNRKKDPPRRVLEFGKQLYDRLYFARMLFFDEEIPWSDWEKLLAPPRDEARNLMNIADAHSLAWADTAKLVKKGQKLRSQYIKEVLNPTNIGDFPATYFWDLTRERHLMWLGDVDARWVSTGPREGRVVRDGEVIFDNYHLTEMSDKGLDELTLDIYIDLYEDYQLTTLRNEALVFGFRIHGNISERSRIALLKETRMDRKALVGLTNLLHTVTRHFVGETNYRERVDSFWNDGARELLNKTYRNFGFDSNDAVASLVAKKGLAAILEDDPDLVRNVAAISLGASSGLSAERLISMCPEIPLKPLETIQRVSQLWKFKELPLAEIGADGFLSSAF